MRDCSGAVPEASMQSAIPIVRIFSVDLAKAFYLDFLSFTLDWEHQFEPGLPLYAQIHRDGLTLHLSEHYGDATPGSTVFVPVTDIKALEAELLGKEHGYARPRAEEMPWGMEMEVHDPFGNRLRFCQRKEAKDLRGETDD